MEFMGCLQELIKSQNYIDINKTTALDPFALLSKIVWFTPYV